MKYLQTLSTLSRRGRLATGSALLCLLTPGALLAQGSSSDDQTTATDVVELSPFEVSASDESTYRIADTLAGSRLRTNMQDIGASISHLSADFLSDIGASDLSEMLAYLPSAEQEETAVNEVDFSGVFRAQRYRVRGLFTESIARNYHTGIEGEYMPPIDAYNIDRATLSAGANSILFGSANPAGMINTQTIRPNTSRTFHKFVHRTDNYGSQRFEYHGNFALAKDKFAVRVAVLEESRELYLDPQWKDQSRVYGAIRWRITDRTTLNANLENIDFTRNAPVATIYKDRANLWRDAGENTVTLTGGNPNNPAFGIRTYTGGQNTNAVLGSNDANTPIAQNWRHHGVSNDSPFSVTGRRGISNLSLYEPDTNLGANWRIDDREATTGDISLEHKFTDNLHAQISYFGFEHKKQVYVGMGSNLFGDASNNYNVGGPNPNAGRYFIDSQRMRLQDFEYDGSNLRATLSYDLDFRESREWLGRHQIALMAENNVGHRFTDRNDLMNTDPNTMLNRNPLNALNRIRPIYYVNLDGTSPSPSGQPDDSRDLVPYLQANGYPGAEYVPTLAGINVETEQTAYLAAAQSHWFGDRLVTTVGYREDQQDVYDISSGWPVDDRGYFVSFRDLADTGVERTKNAGVSDISEDTYSLGGVWHIARAKGALDLFSLTFNTSTNFAPATAQRNFQGETVQSSTGETRDMGFKAELFENKLSFRLSYYESAQKSARQGGANTAFVSLTYDDIWSVLADELNDPSLLDRQLEQVSDTFDIESEGIEMVLNANPMPNLRIYSTLSYNDAELANVNPSSRQYRADNDPMLRSQYGTIPVSDNETVNERLDRLDGDFARVIAQEGQAPIELRNWRFSMMLNYRYTEGPLKGFDVGANATYASNATIGYAQDDTGTLDPNLPFEGEDLFSTGINIGYRHKFEKFDWRVQLNIRNVFNDDDPVAIRADEEVNTNNLPLDTIYRAVEPRSFILTNTFSF